MRIHPAFCLASALAACSVPSSTMPVDAARDDDAERATVPDVTRSDATVRDGSAFDSGFDSGFDSRIDSTDASDVIAPEAATVPVATWVLPRNGPDSFSLPWPSDLTLAPDGTADLRYLVDPRRSLLVTTYITAMDHRLTGFSPVAPVYFRFTVPIDPSTVPSAEQSRHAGASIQLIDIDPASPEHGRRFPVQSYFRTTATHYWPALTLAVAPAWGFPLRPRTRYAMVVTRAIHALDGGTFNRDTDLATVLAPGTSPDPLVARARTLHASAVSDLAAHAIAADSILSLAVFTTDDPASELVRAADYLKSARSAPSLRTLISEGDTDDYMRFSGTYDTPVFQTGALPYTAPGSGDILFDASGMPIVQRADTVRFTLAIPHGDPPASGWPLVLYGDGTGGTAFSAFREDTTAAIVANGVAVMSIDQQFNGTRMDDGDAGIFGGPEAFFNYLNPVAGRLNNVQAALDLLEARRFSHDLVVPARIDDGSNPAFHFDPARTYFFGHSQGSLTGPLYLAIDDGVGASMMSGAGGTLTITILQRTDPSDVLGQIMAATGITQREELTAEHPVIALAQTAGDSADPVNFARRIALDPYPGIRRHSVFYSEGLYDVDAVPDSCVALAIASGAPLVGDAIRAEPAFRLADLAPLALPVRGNLAAGAATAGVRQFSAPAGHNGHFVVYDVPAATNDVAQFFGTAARDASGVPTIVP